MPIYELKCGTGHRWEVIQSFADPLPACPACGAAAAKVPSAFGIQGAARIPPAPERMPQTWRGTYGGNREYVTQLRRTADERRALEERHPELAGDRRPVLAHEGRYEREPLRAGDTTADHGHAHGHSQTLPNGTRPGPAAPQPTKAHEPGPAPPRVHGSP
jgi:putative FmdB family regulatory protein